MHLLKYNHALILYDNAVESLSCFHCIGSLLDQSTPIVLNFLQCGHTNKGELTANSGKNFEKVPFCPKSTYCLILVIID